MKNDTRCHNHRVRNMSIIRYRADIPAIILVLGVLAAQLGIFFLVDSHWLAAGWMLVLSGVQVSSGAICHNHHHVKTFTRNGLNRLYECVLYLQTGTSPFSWTIHHNIGHHGYYLDPSEDPSAWQRSDGTMMGRWHYDFYNALRVYPEIIRIGRRHPHVYRKFKRMFVIANIPLITFIALDPARAAIVFLIPMALQLLLLLDNTYGQHAGTSMDNHLVASRNVELPLYNLSSWNLGFHTAHHMYPGIHWSKLPQVHEKIRDRIPAEMITNTYLLQWQPEKERQQAGEPQ